MNKSTGSGCRKRQVLIVTLSVVMGMLVLGLSVLLYYQKRKNLRLKRQETDMLRQSYVDNRSKEISHEDLELPMFELSTIIKATNDFSLNNKLGGWIWTGF